MSESSSPTAKAETLLQLYDALQGQKVVIATHLNPDGDAIGSSSALARICASVAESVLVYTHDKTPIAMVPLQEGLQIVHDLETVKAFAPAVVIIVDCGHPYRVGEAFGDWIGDFDGVRGVLDHHVIDRPFGDLVYVDTGADSASTVVARFAAAVGFELDELTARGLYTGLFTDTGGFRHTNTDQESFALATRYAQAGVDPSAVARNLYSNEHPARVQLLGKALGSMEIVQDPGRQNNAYAGIVLRESDWPEGVARSEINDDFVEYPRSIRGVRIAYQLKERAAEGGCKISLRSHPPVNVQVIAESFGGGGHKHAAGCFVEGSVEQVMKKLEAAIASNLNHSS